VTALSSHAGDCAVESVLPSLVKVPPSTVRVSSLVVRVLLNSSVDAIAFRREMC
jgi:hypothetical protein